MGLTERDRARYARQLLLPQIGEAGQARLLATAVHAEADVDAGALAVARTYLARAGVRVLDAADADTPALTLPTRSELDRIAGTPELLEAARALAGALGAVEAITAAVLPGAPARSPIPAISSEEV